MFHFLLHLTKFEPKMEDKLLYDSKERQLLIHIHGFIEGSQRGRQSEFSIPLGFLKLFLLYSHTNTPKNAEKPSIPTVADRNHL
jgi:hypothetical protein